MPPVTIDADLELELKFTCARLADLDRAAEVFKSLSLEVRQSNRYTSALHYFDTADLDLRRAGVILRSLDANPPYFNSRVQIKSAATDKTGALSRTEYNLPVSDNGLRLDELKGHVAMAFLKAADKKPYQHWFTAITDRSTIRAMFDINGKAVMLECALDRFHYYRPGEKTTFHRGAEVEIELKQKYSDPTLTEAEAKTLLDTIGRLLTANVPGLRATRQSRADQGFTRLPTGSVPIPPRGRAKNVNPPSG